MKIGIIGAGKIGSTLARLFANAGHEVAISNSRGAESLDALAKEIGGQTQAMTVADAAKWAEVVHLAAPFRNPEALPPPDSVAGKIVIDGMNGYSTDGKVLDLGGRTSSEITRE